MNIKSNNLEKKRSLNLSYVLITTARNEEIFIEHTIKSVVSQSIKPKKWMIVDDSSTDSTGVILDKYVSMYNWIEKMSSKEERKRSFSSKAVCFNTAYKKLKKLQFDLVGNIDADIRFEDDFFEFLLSKFKDFPKLGVAGATFLEDGKQVYDYKFTNIEHVSGQCQLFRRSCIEDIGGYSPVATGGIDWIAVTTARMNGWKTRTFPEKAYHHLRKLGTANSTVLAAAYKYGQKDYSLGWHPLWEVFRVLYQSLSKPILIRGLSLGLGYLTSLIRLKKRNAPYKLMVFHRSEQIRRLRLILYRFIKII